MLFFQAELRPKRADAKVLFFYKLKKNNVRMLTACDYYLFYFHRCCYLSL